MMCAFASCLITSGGDSFPTKRCFVWIYFAAPNTGISDPKLEEEFTQRNMPASEHVGLVRFGSEAWATLAKFPSS